MRFKVYIIPYTQHLAVGELVDDDIYTNKCKERP
jgi:hypothetical protein